MKHASPSEEPWMKELNVILEGRNNVNDKSWEWCVHQEDLRNLEKRMSLADFEYETRQRDLEIEFRIMERITKTNKHTETLVKFTADCKDLNRWRNHMPFTFNNVELKKDKSIVYSDNITYINASICPSLVTNESTDNFDKKLYIATQAPLESSMTHFWEMIWQENVSLLITIIPFHDKGKNRLQSYDIYWPDSGKVLIKGPFTIAHKSEEINNFYVTRMLDLTLNTGRVPETRTIKQLHIYEWQDGRAIKEPYYRDQMILQGQMSLFHSEQGNNPTPIVVHCSAGVGRTGCVIALDQICRQLNDIKNLVGDLSNGSLGTPSLSIFAMVRRLREIRWNMIQNAEQYAFQYSFVGEYQRAQYLNSIPNEISAESNNTDSRISPFSELRDSDINFNNSIDIQQKSNSKKKSTQSHTKKPVLSNNSTMNVGFQEDKKKTKCSMDSPLKINTQISNDSIGQEKFCDLIETPVLGRMNSEILGISKDMFISSSSKDFTNGTTNRERSKTEQSFMSNKNSQCLFAGDMCQEEFLNKNYDKKMSYNLDQIGDNSMGSDDRKPPVKRLKSKKKNKLDYNTINWDDDDSKNIEAAPKFQQEEELESPTYIRKKTREIYQMPISLKKIMT